MRGIANVRCAAANADLLSALSPACADCILVSLCGQVGIPEGRETPSYLLQGWILLLHFFPWESLFFEFRKCFEGKECRTSAQLTWLLVPAVVCAVRGQRICATLLALSIVWQHHLVREVRSLLQSFEGCIWLKFWSGHYQALQQGKPLALRATWLPMKLSGIIVSMIESQWDEFLMNQCPDAEIVWTSTCLVWRELWRNPWDLCHPSTTTTIHHELLLSWIPLGSDFWPWQYGKEGREIDRGIQGVLPPRCQRKFLVQKAFPILLAQWAVGTQRHIAVLKFPTLFL